MPRMRPTIRSGWNGSNSDGRSPVPTNLIGTDVTWRIDSAAPPRASPSILVRITPVSASGLVELPAEPDGVLTGHRVGDEEDLRRIERRLQAAKLVHEGVVDVQPAGGVDEHRVVAAQAGLVERGRSRSQAASRCRRARGP